MFLFNERALRLEPAIMWKKSEKRLYTSNYL